MALYHYSYLILNEVRELNDLVLQRLKMDLEAERERHRETIGTLEQESSRVDQLRKELDKNTAELLDGEHEFKSKVSELHVQLDREKLRNTELSRCDAKLEDGKLFHYLISSSNSSVIARARSNQHRSGNEQYQRCCSTQI